MAKVRRIAKGQLDTLMALARPTLVLITPDRDSRALVARGWCREQDGATAITPAGLRALANQMEGGHVLDPFEELRKRKAAPHA